MPGSSSSPLRSPLRLLWPPVPSATLGVGSSSTTSAARHKPCSPASCDGVRFVCRFSLADARGVGKSSCLTNSFKFDTPAPRPRISATCSGVFAPCTSCACGVGSRPGEDEDAPAEMAGPGTGRGNTDPFRIEPDFGQVCENGSKCPHSRFRTGVSQAPRALFHVAIGSLTEQLLYVLDDHQRRPQCGDGAGD